MKIRNPSLSLWDQLCLRGQGLLRSTWAATCFWPLSGHYLLNSSEHTPAIPARVHTVPFPPPACMAFFGAGLCLTPPSPWRLSQCPTISEALFIFSCSGLLSTHTVLFLPGFHLWPLPLSFPARLEEPPGQEPDLNLTIFLSSENLANSGVHKKRSVNVPTGERWKHQGAERLKSPPEHWS